jgi:hypothetical protein
MTVELRETTDFGIGLGDSAAAELVVAILDVLGQLLDHINFRGGI